MEAADTECVRAKCGALDAELERAHEAWSLENIKKPLAKLL